MKTRPAMQNFDQPDEPNLPTAGANRRAQQSAVQALRISKSMLSRFTLRSLLLTLILAWGLASTTVFAGPVILGGDDLDLHGSYNGSVNLQGWLYIEKALASMYAPNCITRPNNDGCVAVLGAPSATFTSGHAGSAVYYTANVKLGKCVNYYEGAANITAFFTALNNGSVNPAIIYIPSPLASAGLTTAEGNVLTSNAAAIKNFVNSGGGLMAHIVGTGTSGWLTTLSPGLVVNGLCAAGGATLTPAGNTAFPGLTNGDISAGPCHASFSGNLGGLSVLGMDGSSPNKLIFIIGGGCGTTIGVGPTFTATTVCQGQATAFTNTSSGSTSWNWTFGDNTSSALQNPTHVYASAGTYNVKLCINGSTTNCVQNAVTVKALPPAPVIIGPTNTCNGMTATYSVQAVSGVTYTWSIGNGSPAGAIGTSVTITWNAPGGGNIVVTATAANGCTATTRFTVNNCNLYLGACCDTMQIKESATTPVHQGQNIYLFSPALSVTPPANIIRVTATIISTTRTASSNCGTSGPVNSYVTSASAPTGFASSIPVAFGSEAVWHSLSAGGVNMGALGFPFAIQFPPLQGTWWRCSDTITFCVKYQITDYHCRTCEIIRCYSFSRSNIIWVDDHIKNIAIGKVFSPPPSIAIVNADGKPVEDASGKATISIKPGTGARDARLSGQTTVEIVNGRATFRDLSIDRAGQGYVLVVNIPDVAEPLESQPFNVLPER